MSMPLASLHVGVIITVPWLIQVRGTWSVQYGLSDLITESSAQNEQNNLQSCQSGRLSLLSWLARLSLSEVGQPKTSAAAACPSRQPDPSDLDASGVAVCIILACCRYPGNTGLGWNDCSQLQHPPNSSRWGLNSRLKLLQFSISNRSAQARICT